MIIMAAESSLCEKLRCLESRLGALEKRERSKEQSSTICWAENQPEEAMDAFANYMRMRAVAAGFKDTRLVRCPDPYYSWTLEQRRAYLRAPSIRHLTKSIVMVNTRHKDNGSSDVRDPTSSRFLCCIVPYGAKIDSDKLRSGIRDMFAERSLPTPAVKSFNYRLVEECLDVTGYVPNGVTPLGIRTPMPIVVATPIKDLRPKEFWLGAGEVSLKWRVRLDEFFDVFQPFVIDFVEQKN